MNFNADQGNIKIKGALPSEKSIFICPKVQDLWMPQKFCLTWAELTRMLDLWSQIKYFCCDCLLNINFSGTVWQSVSWVLMKEANNFMGAFQCTKMSSSSIFCLVGLHFKSVFFLLVWRQQLTLFTIAELVKCKVNCSIFRCIIACLL